MSNRYKPAPDEVFTVGEELSLPPRFDEIARCSMCRFSERLPRTNDRYTCRINPPVVNPQGTYMGVDWYGVWPVVHEDDHCGRYWPREPLHVDDALITAYLAYREHEAKLEALAKRHEDRQATGTRKVLTVKKSA